MNQNREEILFQLVLTKSSAERVSWLDRECGDDKSLRLRLDALLAAHDQPDELLEGDGIEKTKVMETIKVEFNDEAVGQTLGRYKLLERVGESGCGTVYVVEQPSRCGGAWRSGRLNVKLQFRSG